MAGPARGSARSWLCGRSHSTRFGRVAGMVERVDGGAGCTTRRCLRTTRPSLTWGCLAALARLHGGLACRALRRRPCSSHKHGAARARGEAKGARVRVAALGDHTHLAVDCSGGQQQRTGRAAQQPRAGSRPTQRPPQPAQPSRTASWCGGWDSVPASSAQTDSSPHTTPTAGAAAAGGRRRALVAEARRHVARAPPARARIACGAGGGQGAR